jgi:cell division GTPase FtsZ
MSDQVRITVIATGFDETQARISKMRPAEPVRLEGVISSTPREEVVQEQQQQRSEEQQPREIPNDPNKDEFGEDFEIPAFLRKIH